MKYLSFFLLSLFIFTSCQGQTRSKKSRSEVYKISLTPPKGKAMAAFASGCFWCVEHVYESVIGIDSVVSGYSGGKTDNPTYETVSSETTGHAEAVMVYYNPKLIDYKELVKIFFASHDPTTLNRQGPDVGTSYRSVVFYQSQEQKETAMQAIRDIAKSGKYKKPVVTELLPLTAFWRAEEYHQDYSTKNPTNPYIRGVSKPRFERFKEEYKGKTKH